MQFIALLIVIFVFWKMYDWVTSQVSPVILGSAALVTGFWVVWKVLGAIFVAREPPAQTARPAAPVTGAFGGRFPPNVSLTYRDQDGAITDREVRVSHIKDGVALDEGGETDLLVGFCFLRREKRSFRADRILILADLETGEVIDEPAGILEWCGARRARQQEEWRRTV